MTIYQVEAKAYTIWLLVLTVSILSVFQFPRDRVLQLEYLTLTSTTRLGSRLHDPHVLSTVDVELRAGGTQLCQHHLDVMSIILQAGNRNVLPTAHISASSLIPSAFHKSLRWWCHTLQFMFRLLTTPALHQAFTVSFQTQNSPFPQIFSIVVC